MNYSQQHQLGPYVLCELAQVPLAGTAGSSPDAAQQNGRTIDRLASGRGHYDSAVLVIAYKATVNTSETLSLAANGQMATDSGFSSSTAMVATRAYQVASDGTQTALTLTSGALANQQITAAGTVQGVVVMEFDLHDCQEYLRSQLTFDLSRANTDTFVISAVWVFGGAQLVPAV